MTQQKTPKLFKNFRGLLAFNPFLSYNLGETIKKTTRGGLKMYQTARANQTVSQGYEVYMISATDIKTVTVYSRLSSYILTPHCFFVKNFKHRNGKNFSCQLKKPVLQYH